MFLSCSIHHFADARAWAEVAADRLATALTHALARHPTTVLMVPGGRTATAVLPVLAGTELPWRRVIITLADERCLPTSHPDSNEGLVRRLLGPRLEGGAAAATLAGLYRPDETPARAALRLGALPRPFGAVLLGMGEDGHIASLFPGDPANADPGPMALVQRPDHPRLTWTPQFLTDTRALVLAFAGATKAALLERALADGLPADLPVRHVLRAGATVLVHGKAQ